MALVGYSCPWRRSSNRRRSDLPWVFKVITISAVNQWFMDNKASTYGQDLLEGAAELWAKAQQARQAGNNTNAMKYAKGAASYYKSLLGRIKSANPGVSVYADVQKVTSGSFSNEDIWPSGVRADAIEQTIGEGTGSAMVSLSSAFYKKLKDAVTPVQQSKQYERVTVTTTVPWGKIVFAAGAIFVALAAFAALRRR
jgi:hypothetical protein